MPARKPPGEVWVYIGLGSQPGGVLGYPPGGDAGLQWHRYVLAAAPTVGAGARKRKGTKK